MNTEVAVIDHQAPREVAPLSAEEIKGQVGLIQSVMRSVMSEGMHFGTIPGTDKPTLLKPGAEKLCLTFRLAPKLHVECRDLGNGHREYEVKCTLIHIPTGQVFGEGVGLCSTLESRYRYRHAERTCPSCGKAAIIKGKAEYGGGFICYAKKGGCGAKFADTDPAIIQQQVGKVENPDLADVYNTCLKMAKKRAHIDSVLTATAASDCFTQDIEPEEVDPEPARPARAKAEPETQEAPPPRQATSSPVVTRGQLEIIQEQLKRAAVNEQSWKTYLFQNFRISDPSKLKQSSVDEVLTWLTQQQPQPQESKAF
jgi:hypothetical protein